MPVQGILADVLSLISGVPHGSGLDPLGLSMHRRPLRIITEIYGDNYQLYINETQLYISVKPYNTLHFYFSILLTLFRYAKCHI